MIATSRCRVVVAALFMASLAAWAAAASPAAPPSWAVVQRIALGGESRWDYLYVDSAAQRLYVSHASVTEVVDLRTNTRLGTLPDTPGVHGIAIAGALGVGFTSNGRDDTVTVFDLATLQPRRTLHVGGNPDAIVYEPRSARVVTFNGRTHDATVLDAASGAVLGTVPMGGKPEFAQVLAGGDIAVNIEDTHEIAVVDAAAMKVVRRFSLPGCEEPTGLTIDDRQRLYSVCGNAAMVVSDDHGHVLGHAAIGHGADGVVWLEGRAYSANGADATLTIVGESTTGGFEALATVLTERGARTIAVDPATHRLYLPTADFKPPAADAQPGARREAVPGSFHVLVLAPR